MDDQPWADLDEYAEQMLRAEAERRGVTLRDLGVLSARRIAHIKRYEVPLSALPILRDDEETE